jgi:FlaA1/EpsC-like NDP-sugar epimerase
MFKINKTIQTTGPFMRRFFFTIDDAVTLVDTALKKQNILAGKILCPEMKSSTMINIIKNWIKIYGGSYKVINNREGDREDEYLISNNEIKFCEEKMFYGKKYFIVDFIKKSTKPLKKIISSKTCKKLNNKEIAQIIKKGF